MNDDDRRVRKTKKALYDALAKLLMKKKLQNITIRELTDAADIHRATFYAHYQDIYDLYEQIENSVISELNTIVSNDPTHSYDGLYVALIDFIYKNGVLCNMLMSGNGGLDFQKRVNQLLENNYLKIWLYEDGKTDISAEMRYFTAYHIQGCMSIINLWIEDNCNYPKKDILALLRKLNDHIEIIMP